MDPVCTDIARWLAGQGDLGPLDGSSDWSVHHVAEPDRPDNVVTVLDTMGAEPDTDEMDIFRPTFQVRGRGLIYPEVHRRMETIRDLLIGSRSGIVCETSRFFLIVLSSDILPLGRIGDRQLWVLVMNFRAQRTRLE